MGIFLLTFLSSILRGPVGKFSKQRSRNVILAGGNVQNRRGGIVPWPLFPAAAIHRKVPGLLGMLITEPTEN